MIAELKTFIAVVQHGTFSAAADRVGLTQAAVSGHIKRLEEKLGFPLFDRSGHWAKLNNEGYRTLLRAETIVQLVDALGDPEDEGPDSEIRIGAIGSVRAAMLQPALTRFHERYPNERVTIVPGVSLHLLDRFDTSEIDLAVLVRPPFNLPTEAEWTTIARDSYVLLVPASSPENDWKVVLQNERMLGYDRLSFSGRQVDRFLRTLAFPVRETPEVPVHDMLGEVIKGTGVGLVPFTNQLLPLPPSVRALPLHSKGFFREIGIITTRKLAVSPKIDFLKECFIDVANQMAPDTSEIAPADFNPAI